MIRKININQIEKKWQEEWEEKGIYHARDFSEKKKFYLLVEFPYPSGAGLHVGHIRSWVAMDAYARKNRMEGFNVLFPMGWDAFGLPAENYAIKMGVHPSKVVPKNIEIFKKQCQSLGLSFDWSREINTTDPEYYKWTQWIFIQLFNKGLAYQSEAPVNWCSKCKTNLADEEVLENGTHERCGGLTERRLQKQWLLRITKYADRLIKDLEKVDFSKQIKTQQINWIGKKEWLDITYQIEGSDEKIVVSTTRPETNFGATFVVVAPEHPILQKIKISDKYKKEVDEYINKAQKKSELERISEGKEKTGVFTGLYCVNPLNGKKLPIWVTDFVLMSVGTGAVVGVPGHDLRDFEFADKFSLPVVRILVGEDGDTSEITTRGQVQEKDGRMTNSDLLNGFNVKEAYEKIVKYLEKKNWGRKVTRYHLHDWIFSRQHYWGEPIPIIHCPKCGPVPVPEKDLPILLPFLDKYEPSGTGESPLAKAKEWLKVSCPKCGSLGRRETDTMPNWAGSNWYFIRYLDPNYENGLTDERKMKYWLPVDLYQGGFEHTTLHLLYSRFIYKFLYDIKVVPTSEPYLMRRAHGIVLGNDGRKMSKSFGNVINPDQIVSKYGADALRLYEMFMGPFDQTIAWNDESLEGCYRFLGRIWRLFNENVVDKSPQGISIKIHQTIEKVSNDINKLKFNTAVASLMEFANYWNDTKELGKEEAKIFIKLLAPFVPHYAEEIWVNVLGQEFSVHREFWPKFNSQLAKSEQSIVVIQIDGKVRGQLNLNTDESKLQIKVEEKARNDSKISKWIEGKSIKKTVFVPGKIINFVTG